MTAPSGLTAPVHLTRRLTALLPEAALAVTSPPGAAVLCLWLVADTLAHQPLAPETINALMEEPPYWSFCWASGQVLAGWILDNPQAVAGRTVVDVGAGSGVVALAAAQAGARRVIACDIDADARAAVQANAALNGLTIATCAALEDCLHEAEVITAADILYDRDNLGLLDVFRNGAREPAVLLADSRIHDLDPPGYEKLCAVESCTWPDLGEAHEYNQVRLFHCPAG